MLIRPATLNDVDAIHPLKYELVRSWFPDPTEIDRTPEYPGKLRERLTELVAHPWYQYWVAEDNGHVIAVMSASITKHLPGPDWTGIAAHMADLYVHPDYRGRGIAKKLMLLAMDWARDRDAFMADMHATQMAVPMYLAMGWQARDPKEIGKQFTTMQYLFVDEE